MTHKAIITTHDASQIFGTGEGPTADAAIIRAANDANARGEIGPSRLALSEDGIDTLITHGSTPQKAARAARQMIAKSSKGGGR